MAEKRKRGQNFVAEEKDKLVKLLSSHKETILNKKTDGSTNEAKCKAWLEVTNAFNATATVYRTKDSLMKIWEKMKSESKLYYQSTKRTTTGTGGGPSDIKIDPILEQVCALLGRACTGIVGVQDCDSDFISVAIDEDATLCKKQCLDEGPLDNTIMNCFFEAAQDHAPSDSLPDIIDQNLKENQSRPDETETMTRTPLWSRRRPQYSQTNERTAAISSICSRFSDVNKKKEDIEDLKKQLLADEINFKVKLYELQLEAARKEVEIKTEILKQIKGGSLNIQHLFGVPKNND